MLARRLDEIEMGGPASPLTGPGPGCDHLGIDHDLVGHGDQGHGGKFFEQVIGDFPGHALAGLLDVDRLLKASGHTDEHFLEAWLLGLMARREAA